MVKAAKRRSVSALGQRSVRTGEEFLYAIGVNKGELLRRGSKQASKQVRLRWFRYLCVSTN